MFKTDAKPEEIYDIFKSFKKEYYKDEYIKKLTETDFRYKILMREIKHVPKFYEVVNNRDTSRYLGNPLPNWGPKAKAKWIKYAVKKLIL